MSTQLKPLSQGAVWGPRQARHLLNRAGFGVPQSSVETLVKMGPRKAVDSLVQYEKYADNLTEPDFLSPPVEPEEMRQMAAGLSQEERTKLGQEMQQQQREEVEKLKAWWLDRMSITARPLQEKLALFWHGHFATSSDKVKQAISNYELNKVFRRNAAGNFRTLVFEVGKSGAMLRYLDNNQNRKGHPNENWARELMELFTLGIGNYTEEDIKEAARAFSGYTDKGGEFYFNNRQHDYGEKTFLGKTGDLDGADVINTIFEQPQAARFISRKLWEYFVYEEPSKELVEELAGVLRANDYELKPLLETIFLSEEFYGTKALNGQIKSPVQFVVMMMDQLQHRPERRMLLNLALRGLGQDLFQPPNVKGWPGNRAWINTNTLMLRYNIPAYLVLGERPNAKPELRLDETEMNRQKGPPEMAERRGKVREQLAARRRKNTYLDVSKLFAPHEGKTAGEVVDGLADQLIGRPLDETQRATLLQAISPGGTPAAPFHFRDVGNERAATLTHLVLSMAEYQLC